MRLQRDQCLLVREWLLSLIKEDRLEVGSDIANIEYNWPVGPPRCKPLEEGIFEVRSRISSGRTTRVFFFARDDEMFLLHGFIKKTQKTPRQELELAKKRKKRNGGILNDNLKAYRPNF